MPRCIRLWELALVLMLGPIAVADDAKPETAEVKAGPFRVTVELDGVLEAATTHEVVLQPEQWATFTVEKAVPQGTSVKKGEPILWFDARKIDDDIRAARHAVKSGELSIEQAQSELTSLELSVPLDIKAARKALEEARYDLETHEKFWEKLNRESAEQSLKFAKYNLENSQEELDQLEKMYKADDLTEETEEIVLKRARRSVESAQLSVEMAKARHEETMEFKLPRENEQVREKVVRQEIAFDKAEATLPLSLEQKRIELQKLQHAQEQAQEKLDFLLKDRELMVIESPADGIVYYGQAERGKWTTAATLLKQMRKGGSLSTNAIVMTVVEPGDAFLRVDVPEKSLQHVREGIEGVAIPTAVPSLRLPVKVRKVDPIAVKEGVFDGEVVLVEELPAGDELPPLVPGMTAKVKLEAYEAEEALSVPAGAVFTDDDAGQSYVYLDLEGEPQRRDIEVGHRSEERVEVVDGLKAGDKIRLKKPE